MSNKIGHMKITQLASAVILFLLLFTNEIFATLSIILGIGGMALSAVLLYRFVFSDTFTEKVSLLNEVSAKKVFTRKLVDLTYILAVAYLGYTFAAIVLIGLFAYISALTWHVMKIKASLA